MFRVGIYKGETGEKRIYLLKDVWMHEMIDINSKKTKR